MPARYRRTASPYRRGPRRQRIWATLDTNITVGPTTGIQNLDLLTDLEIAGSGVFGSTVMAWILHLHVNNWAAQPDELRVGLIVEDKGYVGTAVDLASSRTLNWAFYQRLYPTSTGAATAINVVADYPFPVVKAKRKLDEFAHIPILALTNISAASKNVDVFSRVLLALP